MELLIICIATIIIIAVLGTIIIRRVLRISNKLTDISKTLDINKNNSEFVNNDWETSKSINKLEASNKSASRVTSPKEIKLQSINGDDNMTLYVEKQLPAIARQIPLSEDQQKNLYSYISSAASTGIAVGAQSLAVSGLYSASAAASTLMKYSDGTFSSIIREGGKISSHAGFTRAGFTAIAPVAIFQVLSVVTGQYYMNIINKQLNKLNNNIEKILQKIEANNKGVLKAISEELPMIAKLNSYSFDDLVIIRTYLIRLNSLLNNYLIQVEENIEKIKNKRENINSFWNHYKDVRLIREEFDNNEIKYLFETANDFAQTATLCQLVYLKILCYLSQESPSCLSKANTIIQSLKTRENSITKDVERLEKEQLEINLWIDKKKTYAISYHEKLELKKYQINDYFNELLDPVKESQEELRKIQTEIADRFEKQQNMYYRLSDDGKAEAYYIKD